MNTSEHSPLAARMRPRTLDEVVGQRALLQTGKPLQRAILEKKAHSMIFWGPPGCGKTSLAHVIANHMDCDIVFLSAVFSGVKDVRAAVASAEQRLKENRKTILFIDEIHRFNKAQQDAFLPFVENGTIILIGATTENPSFALNNALLSRCRVYVLKTLTPEDIIELINQTLCDHERGFGAVEINFPDDVKQRLASMVDGDARRCLNILELAQQLAAQENNVLQFSESLFQELLFGDPRRFDKQGDEFYDQISALHKSVRGSDPDASLYWFTRMIDGGCDPNYIARRLVRMASEDIGNADPRALQITLDAWQAFERLGAPEGELALAQAVIFLASCAKSNASYMAYKAASADVKSSGTLPVPLHLRNAPTKLMKGLDYGKNYRYAHDEPNAYAAGENYFPEGKRPERYYQPTDRGLEKQIKEKLERLQALNAKT